MSSRSRGSRLAGRRTSAVAFLSATIAAAASLLTAAPASALPIVPDTSVSIVASSQNTNQQAGSGPVTLSVTYSPATGTAPIYLAVLSGPATTPPTPAFPAGAACTLGGPGTATCSITNAGTPGTGTPGVDAVEAFADNDGSGTFNAGDVNSGATTVIFSGPPSSVGLTPATSTSTNGTCVLYKLTAADSHGEPAVSRPFTFSVTENSTTTPGDFSFYGPDCETPAGLAVASSTTPTSVTDSVTVVTGADGTASVGIASSAIAPSRVGTGHITVTSVEVPTVGNSATATWTAGGEDAVTTLTATPTNVTQYVNTTATYTVTATDQNGNPVGGVPVNEETATGSGDLLPVTLCGVTNHLGVTHCSLTNASSGEIARDEIDIWVDNNLTGPHTSGPDPEEPQVDVTATFNFQPTFDNNSLKCADQLVGDKGSPIAHCTVPTSQHSVTFTETLTLNNATPGAPAIPVPNAVVDFTASGPSGITPLTGSATTDAHGQATFTVTNPGPANNDTVTVNAAVGAQALTGASVQWQTPTTSAVVVTPALQTVTKGGGVSVTAQVADQFGTPVTTNNSLFYFVSGSDNTVTGTVPTNSTGSATISYTSTASASIPDTISVLDQTVSVPTSTATVLFVAGTTTASTVTVDTTGNGTPAICPSTTGTPHNTNLVPGVSDTNVCALVKNATGEVLAGKTVTFTVNNGQVDSGIPSATSTATYVGTTNINGIAMATVTSTKSGTQTVTATSDSASGTGTLSYASPTIDKARFITVSPASAVLTAGSQQKFTWTVTDQYANPISGAGVVYTQSGAGTAGGASSGLLTTGADGTASIIITTTSTETGAGTVVGTLQQPAYPLPLNQCQDTVDHPLGAAAGTCTASATYTVTPASLPTSLSLTAASGVTAGSQETITATLKNADGSPAPNQVIRFLVTGANGLIGSALTNASGVATFSYLASVAGLDTISAYDDINDDQMQQGNEPGHHVTAVIHGGPERPTIRLSSFAGSVTVHVVTRPELPQDTVTYYVKRYGAFHKIGTSQTGPLGFASKTFFFPKGVHRTFKARVSGKPGIKGAKTAARSITVR